jgi:hypothetical protein
MQTGFLWASKMFHVKHFSFCLIQLYQAIYGIAYGSNEHGKAI